MPVADLEQKHTGDANTHTQINKIKDNAKTNQTSTAQQTQIKQNTPPTMPTAVVLREKLCACVCVCVCVCLILPRLLPVRQGPKLC
jgi:hypothetical protein